MPLSMRLLDIVLAVVILAGLAAIATLIQREEQQAGMARAVDGDTIDLAGTHMRLQGIDAPELHQTCTRDGRDWPCGQAARKALAAALARGPVSCRHRERDKFGRPLVHCAVAGEDLGALMVAQGLAVSYLGSDYAGEEADARAARSGLWAGTFQRPKDYRAAHPR